VTWPVLSKLRKSSGEAGGRSPDAHPLVRHHFVLQDERPAHVRPVEIAALDPFLRNLVFTDGTVTRVLGVQALAPVAVEKVSQEWAPMPAEVAARLEAEAEDESVRRRVRIGTGSSALPLLWAESYILPDRLPPGFMGLLDGAPDGIGQSLQRVALESYRELLWFGLDATPEWAPEADSGVAAIRRQYRVIRGGLAAILISEAFAVQRRGETYFLAGLDERAGARSGEGPEKGGRRR
jgi:chorismate-pyruvate lyase